MVMPDFDVGGSEGGFAAAHHDAFAGGLEKIVDDLERAHGIVPQPACNRLGIDARAGFRDTVEVGEVGIDHGYVAQVAEHDAAHGLLVGGSVDPHAIEDDVVAGSLVRANQVIDDRWRCCARDFQADQAIVVGAGFQKDRSRTALRIEFDLAEHVFGRSTLPAEAGRGERRHPRSMGSTVCPREAASNRGHWCGG